MKSGLSKILRKIFLPLLLLQIFLNIRKRQRIFSFDKHNNYYFIYSIFICAVFKEQYSILVQRTSQPFKQILYGLVSKRSLHGIYYFRFYNFQRLSDILRFLEAISKFYSVLEYSKDDLLQYNRVYHNNNAKVLFFFRLCMEIALHCDVICI